MASCVHVSGRRESRRPRSTRGSGASMRWRRSWKRSRGRARRWSRARSCPDRADESPRPRGAPVKLEFARELRCPACLSDRSLELRARESDAQEVREGALRCKVCGAEFVVHKGVMELLHHPPSYVVAEAAGLERFAEQMAAEGWDREKVRRLPDIEHGYWYAQSRSMHQLMTTIPFKTGQSILDVGSNTCWAANRFALRG